MAGEPRREERTGTPTTGLTEKGQALQGLLQQVLTDFQPETSNTMDIPQISVKPSQIAQICHILKEDPRLSFKLLLCLAAVDYKEHLQVVYLLLSQEHEHKLLIKVDLPYDNPSIPTVSSVWRAASWYEREAHDLFGVVFEGHPNLAPLILYDGFEGYPGRKEFPFHEYKEY